MQTFLPYADFYESSYCLDDRRLNKQIIECKQILLVLEGKSDAWSNHPAVLMWKGHAGGLSEYALAMCHEYESRKKKRHSCNEFIADVWRLNEITYPSWLGYEPFHSMHRAVLLDKDKEWYGRFDWTEKPAEKFWNKSRWSYPYVWPSRIKEFN